MIDVPEIIKYYLHQDTCPKNIRIHFPNGERSDICNNLIVKDSVSFTESLCSQDTLKFGLCESPVFECEVVGVGNIKGATIEVTCEIFCNASVSGAEFKPDLMAYVYPIPYGVFVVNSCQRQGDMAHRKIMAYGGQASFNWDIHPFEKNKYCRATTYNPLLAFFLSSNDFDIVGDYVDETIQPWVKSGRNYPAGNYDVGMNTYPSPTHYVIVHVNEGYFSAWAKFDTSSYHYIALTHIEKNYLFRLDAKFLYDKKMEKDINDLLAPYNLSQEEYHIVHGFLKNGCIRMSDRIDAGSSVTVAYYDISQKYIYPYAENFYRTIDLGGQTTYYLPKNVTVEVRRRGSDKIVAQKTFDVIEGNPVLYERTLKQNYSFLQDFVLTIPAPSKKTNPYPEVTRYFIDYTDINLQTLASAFAELLGCFTYIKGNALENINIKRQFGITPSDTLYPGNNIYPQEVTGGQLYPEDYQSCWYDDEYTKPYGAITCQYKNTNNEDYIYTLYLSGITEETDPNSYKTYELNNNEIIKGSLWTEQQIADICNTIAANIIGVQYMPVEFTGRGLPYVEAGDTFEILTKSGDAITTIVLNRTLTGEQVMTDKYKSV